MAFSKILYQKTPFMMVKWDGVSGAVGGVQHDSIDLAARCLMKWKRCGFFARSDDVCPIAVAPSRLYQMCFTSE